jgi:hypothetical protein
MEMFRIGKGCGMAFYIRIVTVNVNKAFISAIPTFVIQIWQLALQFFASVLLVTPYVSANKLLAISSYCIICSFSVITPYSVRIEFRKVMGCAWP